MALTALLASAATSGSTVNVSELHRRKPRKRISIWYATTASVVKKRPSGPRYHRSSSVSGLRRLQQLKLLPRRKKSRVLWFQR